MASNLEDCSILFSSRHEGKKGEGPSWIHLYRNARPNLVFSWAQVCALASLKLDGLWLGGPASMAFAAAEKAIPCAMQLLGFGLSSARNTSNFDDKTLWSTPIVTTNSDIAKPKKHTNSDYHLFIVHLPTVVVKVFGHNLMNCYDEPWTSQFFWPSFCNKPNERRQMHAARLIDFFSGLQDQEIRKK